MTGQAWATRKGEARSEPECRRHPATYTQPQEGDWLVFQPISAQHPLSTDFFFEPESYTFRAKKIRQSGIALRNLGKKMGCKFLFLYLDFITESSNYFSEDPTNCRKPIFGMLPPNVVLALYRHSALEQQLYLMTMLFFEIFFELKMLFHDVYYELWYKKPDSVKS